MPAEVIATVMVLQALEGLSDREAAGALRRDIACGLRLDDEDFHPTLVAVANDADASHLDGRAELVRLPRVAAGLDLELLLKALSERQVRAILLEGGPTLAGSVLAAGLIDRVVADIALLIRSSRPTRDVERSLRCPPSRATFGDA